MTNVYCLKSNPENLSKKVYTILLVLMPILNQYMFGPLTYIDFFSITGFIIFILNKGKINFQNQHCWIIFFLLYTCCVTYVTAIFIDSISVININLRMIKFIIMMINLFFIAPCLFEFKIALNCYTIAVGFAVLVFIIEYISFFIFHRHLVFLIPGLSLNYENGMMATTLIENNIGRIKDGFFFRPKSIFIEPAYYCLYCTPWLSIAIFRKKLWFLVIVVTISMILSTSTTGLVISVVIWLFYFIFNLNNPSKNLKVIAIVFFVAIVAINYIDMSGFLTSFFDKKREISELSQTSSLTLRVVRGWECLKNLDILHCFFGCGYGNIHAYFFEKGIKTIYDYSNSKLDYMSGFFSVLCSIGFVGFVTYIGAIVSSIKNNFSFATLPLLFVFICFMFSDQVWDTDNYYLCLVLLFTFPKEPNRCDIKSNSLV